MLEAAPIEDHAGGSAGPVERSFPIRGEAAIYPADTSALDRSPIEVQLVEIGRASVGFVSREPMASGSIWRIEFRQRGHTVGEQTIVIDASIRDQHAGFVAVGRFIAPAGLLVVLGVSDLEFNETHEDALDLDAYVDPADVPEAA